MDRQDEIVASGLLSRRGIEGWGSALKHVFPIDQKLAFFDLLKALDDAEGRSGSSGNLTEGGTLS